MITRERAVAVQRAAFRDWIRFAGSSHPDSRLLELDGVCASIAPAARHRSIANSVMFEDPGALAAALDRLAAAYDEAGVEAWVVWCREDERETIELLEGAGHSFDGQPAAMVLELDGFETPALGDLDWDAEASGELLARLNDAAYGHTREDGFGVALARPPAGLGLRLYQARLDGEPVCVLGTIDHEGGDCGIYFVATAEAARGRGLATRLLTAALAEARERGCRTSSLQASPMGEPVYAALGYRAHFRFAMYERRR